jgi:hypothetical protein
MSKLLFAATAALTVATPAVAADDDFHSHLPYLQDSGPYLSEQLPKPAYRQALDTLLRHNVGHVPPWVADILRHGGTEAGSDLVKADGQTFELYYVCRPHRCDQNDIYVMFARHGGKAWVFIENGSRMSYSKIIGTLGNPSAAQMQAVNDHR